MNEKILNKQINRYIQNLQDSNKTDELNERIKREEFYQSYTQQKILDMKESEFFEYISKLWAMVMWGNKQYIVDKLISDNGFKELKSKISNFLFGKDSLEKRWDDFHKSVKGFGPAMMSELLCYIYPNEYMIWNNVVKEAFKNFAIKVPKYNYLITGAEYLKLNEQGKIIKNLINKTQKNEENFLFVDYFFWDCVKNFANDSKEEIINNKDYHNEIVDYIKSIGTLLGYNTNFRGYVGDSGKIADAIWEFNVGNIGKLKYVFEVQDSGHIDSLIVSLMNASQDISVQAVIAISDEKQINKIKQHCKNIEASFNGKLKFWDINEVTKAYTELSSSMEIINRVINTKEE